jgi:hypothetical protein
MQFSLVNRGVSSRKYPSPDRKSTEEIAQIDRIEPKEPKLMNTAARLGAVLNEGGTAREKMKTAGKSQ